MLSKLPVWLLLIISLISAGAQSVGAQALDPTFPPLTLQNAAAVGLVGYVPPLVQPDGKVIIYGSFKFVNGATTGNLARLHTNGALDTTFNPGGTGFDGLVSALLLQPDGRIVATGAFTHYNGASVGQVVRILPNGGLDTSFAVASVVQFPTCLAIQPDGKLLVGDNGRTYPNGNVPTKGLTRLHPDGTLDTSFILPAFAPTNFVSVRRVLVQADGKIVVSGFFNTFGGQPAIGLARLQPNGLADSSFIVTGSPCGGVTSLAQQPDGKLLIAGSFYWCGAVQPEPSHIVRLLANGRLDSTFVTAFVHGQYEINGVAVEPSGQIVLGGAFTYVGSPSNRVIRLHPSGARDYSFATGAGPDDAVKALVPNPGGGSVLAGEFRQIDGQARPNIARLSAAGALDTGFATVLAVEGNIAQVVPLATGQLLVSGSFDKLNGVHTPVGSGTVRRLTANGLLDAAFVSTGTGYLSGVGAAGNFYLSYPTSPPLPNSTPVVESYSANGSLTNSNIFQNTLQGSYTVYKVQEQPDGRLLASGVRSYIMGGFVSGPTIVRVNSGGGLDASFQAAVCRSNYSSNGYGGTAWLQPDGKVVVNCSGYLSRLNADGSTDNSFSGSTIGFPNLLMQPNGQMLVGGTYNSSTYQTYPFGIVRLTLTGQPDPAFVGVTDSCILRAVQPDGRMLVTVGTRVNAVLARLNTDGTRDNTFVPVAIPFGSYTVSLQPTDGKIILVGSFSSVAGQARQNVARLTNPGVLAAYPGQVTSPLAIYPNPTHQQLTVCLPMATGAGVITLFDLAGRKVRTWPWLAQQTQAGLDLATLPEGLYLLRVATAGGRYQQKVVVAR